MKNANNESRYIIQETAEVNAVGDIVVNKKNRMLRGNLRILYARALEGR